MHLDTDNVRFFELNNNNRDTILPELSQFDARFIYPLGNDFFTIDHGEYYLSFFERMGQVFVQGYRYHGAIVFTSTAVLRDLNQQKVFYLCDLKKDPSFNLANSKDLFYQKLNAYLHLSDKAYGIHMDYSHTHYNKVALMVTRIQKDFFKIHAKLHLYSLGYEDIMRYKSLIEEEKQGYINTVSLQGIKDIVLQSSQLPIPLIHLEFKATQDYTYLVDAGYTYMFCTLSDSHLSTQLHSKGIVPSSTATITQHNMENFDFECIHTSEI